MPLSFAKEGEKCAIRKVGGQEATRKFLANLGFVAGSAVKVVSENHGNLIVDVKDTRIAISKEMASHIMVS